MEINLLRKRKAIKKLTYDDFRSFLFLLHDKYGMLLLYNTKKSKGPHYQLPGGHLDEEDFNNRRKLGKILSQEDIIVATKIGASRELYEETGIDVRSDLDRLQAAIVNEEFNDNMIEDRYYNYLFVTDDDFLVPDHAVTGYCTPVSGENIFIKMSDEHNSWTFERDIQKASKMIELHSSGYGKKALENVMQSNNNPFFQSQLRYYYPYKDTGSAGQVSSLFPYAPFLMLVAFLLSFSFILSKCLMKPRSTYRH